MPEENPYESAKSAPPEAASGRAMAFVGKVALGIVALLLLAALLLPATRSAREPARRNVCQSQLKQIVFAMEHYADEHGAFPPAYTVDGEGNRLHSWRTLLLPYLDEQALYESIDLTKPWDDPVNQHACETVLEVFTCPSATGELGPTTYLVVTGSGFLFNDAIASKPSDIVDDLGETIAVVDVDSLHAVEWMSPNDISFEGYYEQSTDDRHQHADRNLVGFSDGRVRAMPKELPREQLRAMLTIAGGETIGEE